MRVMKKRAAVACLVAIYILIGILPQIQAEEYWPEGPKIETPCAAVIEVNTGTLLYEKKSHKKLYPASITKIMTTLLAIEQCDLDETVVFSADAVYKNEGNTSHIARDLGEEMTMEQCLYAVMLESANECAYAVAEHVGEKLGGDYRTFIDLMNTRAKGLGCEDTHFNNCNGLPDEEHVISAYDMALISAEAYRNDTFRIIAGSESYTIPPTNKHEDATPCHNHHKMIYPWQGDTHYLWDAATGGKTGYTVAAKNTLVTFAERDGLTLVCVVMNTDAPNHYNDSRTLLEYCFENFQALNIAEHETSLGNDKQKSIGVLNENGPFVTLDKNAYIVMPRAARFSDAAFALDSDTESGETLVQLSYTYHDRLVGHAEIVTTGNQVEENYFEKPDSDLSSDGALRVIEIRPVMLIAAALLLAVLVLGIYFGKKLYDNFYLIRYRRERRREQRERFKIHKEKKSRRRNNRRFKR